MNFLGDTMLTTLMFIFYLVLLTIFFNFARRIRLTMRKKRAIKKAHKFLELEELPLHKNKEIYWSKLEKMAKKLPDSRDKHIFLREVREQMEYNKLKK